MSQLHQSTRGVTDKPKTRSSTSLTVRRGYVATVYYAGAPSGFFSVPQGRLTIAQRFIAGKRTFSFSGKPRRDD